MSKKRKTVIHDTPKYYSLDRILSKEACYNMRGWERAHGKTESVVK